MDSSIRPYTCRTYCSLAMSPTNKTPHMPQKPCMGAAASGSSIFSLRSNAHTPSKMNEATKPHKRAAAGSITEHPAVTETSPQSNPLQTAPGSHLPVLILRNKSDVIPPMAPDRVVQTAARPTISKSVLPWMASCEPGLNPNQPNHNVKVPITTSVIEWPSNPSVGLPFESKRPDRGPMMYAPTSPARPPTICTTPLPAKSIIPESRKGSSRKPVSQPSRDQIQCATTGYTKPLRKIE
mmetsp:Transcript_33053/g.55324  ORF Transcript_33053/g.55324 Transcript_33053/m.55324 type:complete len:238 (+) Transcript_33053:941-1654(+)